MLLDVCDGSNPTITANLACTVPLSKMSVAPFNLILGDSIFAKIVAINAYGSSLESIPGNGAPVVFAPDAPMNLANNPALTNAV